MATSRIRIVMKSYDHNLLDKSTEKLVKTIKETGAVLSGPIPMPTKRKVYTVLRSPHVNKKSREQFEIRVHKRLIDIYANSSRTVEELMKLDLPSGVDISVKV